MTIMTFSISNKSKKVINTKEQEGIEDFVKKIECCKNFSPENIRMNLREDIKLGKYKSVVLKKETLNNYVSYEYWEKINGQPTYYTIAISTFTKQLDTIRDEYGYTVPTSALRIDSNNELQIIAYDRCSPF